MMSLETIRDMSRQFARKAASAKMKPMAIFDENDVDNVFNAPVLGSYVPKGFKLVDRLFCDNSGLGAPDEPALTVDQVREVIRKHVREGNPYYYAVTEVGPFQIYLGVFEKEEDS